MKEYLLGLARELVPLCPRCKRALYRDIVARDDHEGIWLWCKCEWDHFIPFSAFDEKNNEAKDKDAAAYSMHEACQLALEALYEQQPSLGRTTQKGLNSLANAGMKTPQVVIALKAAIEIYDSVFGEEDQ